MSSSLTIDGKEYISAISAGKRFGYTKDYILLLIKNGKIEGQKIGHKWYVHPTSAEDHFETAKKHHEFQRQQMSLDRKAELAEKTHTKIQSHVRTAMVETLAIVVIGLSLGVTGYFSTGTQIATVKSSDTPYLENVALAWYSIFSNDSEETYVINTIENEAQVSSETVVQEGLIILPENDDTENSIQKIKESFSDSVVVAADPNDSQTGIVTPVFKNATDEEYRFLMVPVTTKTP